MTNIAVKECVLAFAALMLAAAACGTRPGSAERAAVTYPEPRFPSYLKPPATLEDADYAANPWKTVKGVIDHVLAGNSDHFYPLRSGHHPSGPKPTEP